MRETIEKTLDYKLFCESRLSDPYPLYAKLREEEPVHFSKILNTWIISRYEDVKLALSDDRLSNNKIAFYLNPLEPKVRERIKPLTKHISQWMSMKDPPDHTRLRSLINKGFTAKSLEKLTPRIRIISEKLVDDLVEYGQADLIADFAYPLPATVICEMLGIPPGDQAQFRAWSTDIVAFSAGSSILLEKVAEKATASQLELIEYCRHIINKRRTHPKDDLISRLITIAQKEAQLNEIELYALCVQLLVAGQETTTNLIGNGILSLLKQPESYQLLRNKPELIGPTIEELLRYESPVQRTVRVVRKDLKIQGKRMEKGQSVMLMLGSANRDPIQFPNPESLILDRTPNRHLAFGRGPHFCIGAPLARRETKIAFQTLLLKLSNIELTEKYYNWRRTMAMRGLESLKVAVSISGNLKQTFQK